MEVTPNALAPISDLPVRNKENPLCYLIVDVLPLPTMALLKKEVPGTVFPQK